MENTWAVVFERYGIVVVDTCGVTEAYAKADAADSNSMGARAHRLAVDLAPVMRRALMDLVVTKESWVVEMSNHGWTKPVTVTFSFRAAARDYRKSNRKAWDKVVIVHRTTTTYRSKPKKKAGGK